MHQLLGQMLLQKLHKIGEEIFELSRDYYVDVQQYWKSEQKGTNFLRANTWKKGRQQRDRIARLTTVYQMLRRHLLQVFNISEAQMDAVEDLKIRSHDLDFQYETEVK